MPRAIGPRPAPPWPRSWPAPPVPAASSGGQDSHRLDGQRAPRRHRRLLDTGASRCRPSSGSRGSMFSGRMSGSTRAGPPASSERLMDRDIRRGLRARNLGEALAGDQRLPRRRPTRRGRAGRRRPGASPQTSAISSDGLEHETAGDLEAPLEITEIERGPAGGPVGEVAEVAALTSSGPKVRVVEHRRRRARVRFDRDGSLRPWWRCTRRTAAPARARAGAGARQLSAV